MTYQISYFAVHDLSRRTLNNALGDLWPTKREACNEMRDRGISLYHIVCVCEVVDDNGEDVIDFGYGQDRKEAKKNVLPKYNLK